MESLCMNGPLMTRQFNAPTTTLKADDALQMVKNALSTEAVTQNFELRDERGLKPYMGSWGLAYGYINAKKKIFEMPWQKYLVMQLVQLIIEGEHSMLVSVGTGHGKSVIIQLLSDILAL